MRTLLLLVLWPLLCSPGLTAAQEPPGARELRRHPPARNRTASAQRARARARLIRHLGDRPISSAVQRELGLHAHRIARLMRIRQLAGAAGDEPSLERVGILQIKENARHERWMVTYAHDPSAVNQRRLERGAR